MSKKTRNKRRRPQSGAGTRSVDVFDEDNAQGDGKMSEVVVDLARPWLERLGPNPPSLAVEFGYQLCGLLWNVSRLRDVESREGELARVLRDVVAMAPDGTQREVERFAIGVYRRALEFHPDDPRHIVDVGIESRAGRFHVTVLSLRGGRAPN
jgi:hypothetical protein